MVDPSPIHGAGAIPFQSTTPPSGPGELLLLAGGVITIVIGFAIAYVAFRGYRRNESRPMLFIAIGFVLAIAFPGTLDITLYTILLTTQIQLPISRLSLAGIMQASQLLGMASILYALLTQ